MSEKLSYSLKSAKMLDSTRGGPKDFKGGGGGSRGRILGVCGLYFQYTFGDIYFEHDRDCMF